MSAALSWSSGASLVDTSVRSAADSRSGDAKIEKTGVFVTSSAPLRSRMLPRTAGSVIVSSW